MTAYKAFTINTAGDPKPWGAREEQAIKDIIDTLVGDTVGAGKRVAGHLHMDVYDINGVKIISTREDIDVDIIGRDLRVTGPDGYVAPGHRARVAVLSRGGGEGAGKFRAGMVCEFKYGLALSVFKWGATGAKIGEGAIDVLKIREAGTVEGHLGGETGILAEPVPGLTFILERMTNGHLGFKDGASVAHMLYTAASGVLLDKSFMSSGRVSAGGELGNLITGAHMAYVTNLAKIFGYNGTQTTPLLVSGVHNLNPDDLFTGPSAWVDFSESMALAGWASTTVKIARYQMIGKTCNMFVHVQGIANDQIPMFTTPVPIADYPGGALLSTMLANMDGTNEIGIITTDNANPTKMKLHRNPAYQVWTNTLSAGFSANFTFHADALPA